MAQKTDTRTKLLTAPPFQLMLSLSIPAIIGMVVVGLYNFMDRVFVGQLINEVAMGQFPFLSQIRVEGSLIPEIFGVGFSAMLMQSFFSQSM